MVSRNETGKAVVDREPDQRRDDNVIQNWQEMIEIEELTSSVPTSQDAAPSLFDRYLIAMHPRRHALLTQLVCITSSRPEVITIKNERRHWPDQISNASQ